MLNKPFNEGIIARSLSTNQTDASHEANLEKLQRWSDIGRNLIESTSPDKRYLATGVDNFFLQYDMDFRQDTTYGEWVWSLCAHLDTILGINFCDPTAEEHVLVTPSALFPSLEALLNPNKHFYFLNNFSLLVFERFISETYPLQLGNFKYSAISYFDLLSGSYDNFFNYVKLCEWDALTANDTLISAAMDSVRSKGMFILYDVSCGGTLYENPIAAYEHRMYRTSKRIAVRPDFNVTHIPGVRGYIVGQKN